MMTRHVELAGRGKLASNDLEHNQLKVLYSVIISPNSGDI
jgi:hypothetical protein